MCDSVPSIIQVAYLMIANIALTTQVCRLILSASLPIATHNEGCRSIYHRPCLSDNRTMPAVSGLDGATTHPAPSGDLLLRSQEGRRVPLAHKITRCGLLGRGY